MGGWLPNAQVYRDWVVPGGGLVLGAIVCWQAMRADRRRAAALEQMAASVEALAKTVAALAQHMKSVQDGAVVTEAFRPARALSRAYSEDDIFEDTFDTLQEGDRVGDAGEEGGLDSAETIFAECDSLRERDQPMDAYNLLFSHKDSMEETPALLWRLSRSCVDAGKASPKDERVRLEEAIEYAKRALALDDTDPNCHKWFAIPSGAMSSHVSLNEKLVCGKVFKQHIDRCIELDPTNAGSYNLVGRWSFEVAGLSWIEKRACAAIFGEPPSATYEETLDQFLKAEELGCPWKSNPFFIAKTYAKLGNKEESRKWLKICLERPSLTAEDRETHAAAQKLL